LHEDDNTWYYKLIEPIFAGLDFIFLFEIFNVDFGNWWLNEFGEFIV
jgi:hypothetical protein